MSPRNRYCHGGILFKNGTSKNDPIRYIIVKGRHLGIWSFPKGHSRREEESLVCAKREIEEETGIRLEKEPIRHHRLKGASYFVFDCNDLEVDNFMTQDTNEIEEVRWVTREEMNTLKVNSGIKEFLKRKNIVCDKNDITDNTNDME